MPNKIELEINKNENDSIYTKLQKIPNSNRFLKKVTLDPEYNKNSIISFTFYRMDLKTILNSPSIKLFNKDSYGVYFLINEQNNSIYIGKTRNIENRMKNHDSNKNFDRIIILTKSSWTTTIIDYLEWWFINFFINNQTEFRLENKKEESEPNYNHHDKKIIESTLENSFWLLLNEGINILPNMENDNNLRSNLLTDNSFYDKNNEVYYKNIKAFYYPNNKSNQKILLLKGTKIIWNNFDLKDFSKTTIHNIKRYNNFFEESLKNNKIFKSNNNEYILNEDIYESPSFAACLIDGYFTRNGNDCWKFDNGKFIK